MLQATSEIACQPNEAAAVGAPITVLLAILHHGLRATAQRC